MATKRINQLNEEIIAALPDNTTLNPGDFLVVDVFSSGTYTTKKLSIGSLNNHIAKLSSSLPPLAYIYDIATHSIRANEATVSATGYYSYASGMNVTSIGDLAFIHSMNSMAYASHSAILGGINIILNNTATRSVVLGGNWSTENISRPDTVYVPNLYVKDDLEVRKDLQVIGQVKFDNIVSDTSVDELLLIDNTTKEVKRRPVSSLNINNDTVT